MHNQTKSLILRWLTPMAVLIVVLAIMMYNFSSKSRAAANNTVTKNITMTAQNTMNDFDDQLVLLKHVGEPIVALLEKEDELSSERVQDLTEIAMKYSGAYAACTCDDDGYGVDNTGAEVSIAEWNYFETVRETQTISYLYVADDGIGGKKAIVVVMPVFHGDEIRHLLLFYSLSNFDAIVKKVDYTAWTIVALIDKSGEIIFSSGKGNPWVTGDNLYEALKKNNAGAVAKMEKGINSGVSSEVAATVGSIDNMLVYIPAASNDWALITGVPQTYVDRLVTQQYKSFLDMLYQILVVFALFFCIIVGINIVSKLYVSKKQRQLEIKADTDLLTGLNNKLATERKIKEYIEHNPNSQSMMFILDIDNFKKINDTMGHAFGDVVLRTLGHSIGALFRSTDIIGRAGGDEFIIFLKGISDPDAIRKEAKKVEDFFKDFKAGEYTKYAATASIGVAIYPQEGADFESIYKAADQALYKAKKRGKNQLAFYKDEWGGVIQ